MVVAPAGVAVAVGTQILMVIIHFALKVSSFRARVMGGCGLMVLGRQNFAMCYELYYYAFHHCELYLQIRG